MSFPRRRESRHVPILLDPRPRSGRGQALRGGDIVEPIPSGLLRTILLLEVMADGLQLKD